MKVHEQSHSDLAFVFISDLHLDQPKTLSSFRSMLQGYLDADFIPFAFVLCGSFLENSKTGKGDLISRYQGELVLRPRYTCLLSLTGFSFHRGIL